MMWEDSHRRTRFENNEIYVYLLVLRHDHSIIISENLEIRVTVWDVTNHQQNSEMYVNAKIELTWFKFFQGQLN